MIDTVTRSSPKIKSTPPREEWRYEDYLNLPDDGQRYEIIGGVLYVTSAPSYDHQFTVLEIAAEMRQFVREHQLGQVLVAPFEIHLAEDTRPLQPDVLFIKKERQPRRGAKFFEGPPDLVVEVISPSSLRTDRLVKFTTYQQFGVAEYWLVDPKYGYVEVYTLEAGEFKLLGQFDGEQIIQSKILAGLEIVTQTLFVTE